MGGEVTTGYEKCLSVDADLHCPKNLYSVYHGINEKKPYPIFSKAVYRFAKRCHIILIYALQILVHTPPSWHARSIADPVQCPLSHQTNAPKGFPDIL